MTKFTELKTVECTPPANRGTNPPTNLRNPHRFVDHLFCDYLAGGIDFGGKDQDQIVPFLESFLGDFDLVQVAGGAKLPNAYRCHYEIKKGANSHGFISTDPLSDSNTPIYLVVSGSASRDYFNVLHSPSRNFKWVPSRIDVALDFAESYDRMRSALVGDSWLVGYSETLGGLSVPVAGADSRIKIRTAGYQNPSIYWELGDAKIRFYDKQRERHDKMGHQGRLDFPDDLQRIEIEVKPRTARKAAISSLTTLEEIFCSTPLGSRFFSEMSGLSFESVPSVSLTRKEKTPWFLVQMGYEVEKLKREGLTLESAVQHVLQQSLDFAETDLHLSDEAISGAFFGALNERSELKHRK